MYLKELTAAGFKSFASTTRFRFERGITAIVGPNGSGKSNVVDALAWVMGEQGAKSLRGANMADVIFAGAATRPALGRAHVELTIDNADGRLPIAYSEVTIARTMFRSGGSEYSINRQPVRLLDVQELLSDSGLGRQMHVIVGQGQLDAVLSASPMDRRAFIDEAAGVAKHRRRKERALRKLDSMDANLVRVLDLTEEMQSRLRPLARQAKAAREAAGVRYALGYASARILADDLVTARSQRDHELVALEELREASRREEAALADLRSTRDRLIVAQGRARERADLIGERYRDFKEQGQRLVSLAEIAQERGDSAARVPVAVSLGAVEQADRRAKEARAEAERVAKNAGEAEAAQQERRQQTAQAQEAQRDADAARSAAEAALRRQEENRARLVRAAENAEANLRAAAEQVKVASDRLEAARQRVSEAALEVERFSASGAPEDAGSEGGANRGETADYETAASREREARDLLNEAEKAERGAREQLFGVRSRRETLEKSIAGASGKPGGEGADPREVTSLRRLLPTGKLVEDALQVERGWEEAIAALIGEMLDAQVISREEFTEVIQVLPNWASAPEADSSGFVTAAAPGTVEPGATDMDVLAAEHGVLSVAQIVQGAPGQWDLLAECWVSEGVQEAQSFLDAAAQAVGPGALQRTRVATRSGMVLGRDYLRLRGRRETSNLSLKAELAEARRHEDAAMAATSETERRAQVARSALAAATAQKDDALKQLRAADAQRARHAQELARLQALEHAARTEVDRVEVQLQQSEERAEKARETWERAQAQIPDAREEDGEDALAEVRDRAERAARAFEVAREAENEGRLTLHIAQERATAAHRQAQAFAAQAQSLREDRERQLAREAEAARAATGYQQVVAQAQEGARRAESAAALALELRAAARSQYDSLTESLAQTATDVARSEALGQETAERLLQSEVAYAGHQNEVARLEERAAQLIEEYGRLLNLRAPSLMRKYGENDPEAASLPQEDDPARGRGRGEPSTDAVAPEPSSAEVMAGDMVIRSYGPHHPWAPQPPGEAQPSGETQPAGADEPPRPSEPERFDRDYAEAEQQRAQRALSRLGVVNPLAVEEYEAASARFTFLQEQVEDLNRSKSDLLALIREVDEQVRQAFTSAFEDTATRFEHTFAALFPGGTGRLELTDPDDPLGTGVEIYARPSGKRVTRLSLLSGGERSLAALAYLIAIFQARPSPFYVLDEIEAALDDLNLSRVLGLLEELREESQLLIITHQKRTMEFADALYGVTMKDGVTAVMSHKMADG